MSLMETPEMPNQVLYEEDSNGSLPAVVSRTPDSRGMIEVLGRDKS